MLGKEYSIIEIFYALIIIILIYYFTQNWNITLFQLCLFIGIVYTILSISNNRKEQLTILKSNTNITETNSKSLLDFVNEISYFQKYNPKTYSEFIDKLKNFINLKKFIKIHKDNNYKLYPEKILLENLNTQKKDLLETFVSFEHTLDDRITSIYELNNLSKRLNSILSKSNLTI